MEKRKILIQIDSDPLPSVFDRVVAVDAGAEEVFSYGGVRPEMVRDLVHGAIFTRGPKDLNRTAFFVGGLCALGMAYSFLLMLSSTSVWLVRNQSMYELWWLFTSLMRYPKEIFRGAELTIGNGEIDLRPMTAGQEVHIYATLQQNTMLTTFEPHMHAAGVRMCLEAIWGGRTETLSCAGYDHNWVRGYHYQDDAMPLLPKGTILHIIGFMDNSPSNKNIPDPRNWQGSGNRSVANMFIDLGNRVGLTDEQFQEEMEKRVAANPGKDIYMGCPLCGVVAKQMKSRPASQPSSGQNQNQNQ